MHKIKAVVSNANKLVTESNILVSCDRLHYEFAKLAIIKGHMFIFSEVSK